VTPVGKFSGRPNVQQISRWTFRLNEDLTFNDPVHGLRTCPAGYVSDLASIRILRRLCQWTASLAVVAAVLIFVLAARKWEWLVSCFGIASVVFLALYAMVVGYGMGPAFIHDWEYDLAQLSRRDCDALFERALHTGDGTARWRSLGLFWAGVRIGGHWSYNQTKPNLTN
jgi:hypothetical protein